MVVARLNIYNMAEELTAVFSNKLPKACPIKSMERVQKALPGGGKSDTLTFSVSAAHPDAIHVIEDGYAGFWDEDNYFQLYRILRVESTDSGDSAENLITATCQHAFYELAGEWIDDKRLTDKTAAYAVAQMLEGTRWQLGQADDLGLHSVRVYDKSVLAGLVAVSAKWGGELNFRLEAIGNEITGRYVDILTRRGRDTGKRFERSRDLISVRQTIDKSNICTKLYGRGKGEEIANDDPNDPAYGRRVRFTDVVWSVSKGDPADKPAGQDWIGDENARLAFGPGGRHICNVVYFNDVTEPEELLRLTYEELQKRLTPNQTYELDIMLLEHLTGYSHEAVRLGDTTTVINTSYAIRLTCAARIVELRTNYINPDASKAVLGNHIPGLTSKLSELEARQNNIDAKAGVYDRANAIDAAPLPGGDLEYKINANRVKLYSLVSNWYTKNGNFIFESADQSGAMMIGGGMFGLASGKLPNGEWNWRIFGDGHGFTADEIVTGTLRASVVFAGTLFGVVGSFRNLMAGIADHQRIDMGSDDDGFPFLDMFDANNNKFISLFKRGVRIGHFVISPHSTPTSQGIAVFEHQEEE